MNEYKKRIIILILALVFFVVCVGLVFVGHRDVGLAGLGVQMLGLSGLIVLLWFYNRQFK